MLPSLCSGISLWLLLVGTSTARLPLFKNFCKKKSLVLIQRWEFRQGWADFCPQASPGCLVLSPKQLRVCFEKLPELWKAVSQREINEEFGKRKMWRHSKGLRDPENPGQAVGWVLVVLIPIPAGRSRGGRRMAAASRNCWEEAATASREQRALKGGEINCGASLPNVLLEILSCLVPQAEGSARNNPPRRHPGLWSDRDPSWQQEGQNLPQQERALKEKPPGFQTGFSKSVLAQSCARRSFGKEIPHPFHLLPGAVSEGPKPSENIQENSIFQAG